MDAILQKPMITKSQEKMMENLLLLTEISKSTKRKADKQSDKERDKQPDTTDMPEIESEESAEQNRKQKAVELKILTPSQMLSRLPITLARLKAGNNSEKLNIEIRQLLYFLCRSNKLSKTIYKNLINTI